MKIMTNLTKAFAVIGLVSVSFSAGATSILSGDHGLASANFFPFGGTGGDRYQMVYDSGLFSGSSTIQDFSFFADTATSGTTVSADLDIFMSHTSKAVDALDTTMDNNLGVDNTLVWSGAIGNTLNDGEKLTFVTNWDFDPGIGNLLIDFRFSNQSGGNLSFEDMNATSWANTHSRMHNFGSGFAGYGLVTEFTVGTSSAVPEPTGLALLGLGLAGMGIARKRKQA